ncbi:MAG: beta-N-acetylhexosaminidase [Clostridia bacterium]|nr:beta-N-acetylhexosaminidase [Clostridia bacterium]
MLHLLPYPQKVAGGESSVRLSLAVSGDLFPMATKTFVEYTRRIYGVEVSVSDGGLTLVLDTALPSEGYRLSVTKSGVVLSAATEAGAQNGVITLLQLMDGTLDDGCMSLPVCEIEDTPDCSWRGMMVDLARDFHKLPVLYDYVDLCRFYKIRYLHLHFTDDQSYTLPSRAYPALSTANRFYTEDELKGLIAYAKARGVEIIPEIDVPGHCTSFAEGYGDIFGRDGIISQSEASMEAMETIFGELCDLFSESEYIHMGGDEASIAKWCDDQGTLEAFRAKGVDVDGMDKQALAEYLYAAFIARICEKITACGKTPVVWEGFHESVNHMIPKNAVVMSWENFYQTTPSLQKAGFRLINCSWAPMYVVTPVAHWPLNEVYDWSIYKWRPVHPGSPYLHTGLEIEPTKQVEGGQLLAWGDHIPTRFENIDDGVRAEFDLMAERASALSENTWNVEKRCDFEAFSARHGHVSRLLTELIRNQGGRA